LNIIKFHNRKKGRLFFLNYSEYNLKLERGEESFKP